MSEVVRVGLDIAEGVCQVPRADGSVRGVLRRQMQHDRVLTYSGQLPP